MSQSEELIKQMDRVIAEQYSNAKQQYYYNGDGLFRKFCIDHNFKDDDIKAQLTTNNPSLCTLTNFDNNFLSVCIGISSATHQQTAFAKLKSIYEHLDNENPLKDKQHPEEATLVDALIDYHSINVENDNEHNTLITFYDTNGVKILNAFIILLESNGFNDRLYDEITHSNAINITSCDADSCEYLQRHTRDRTQDRLHSEPMNDIRKLSHYTSNTIHIDDDDDDDDEDDDWATVIIKDIPSQVDLHSEVFDDEQDVIKFNFIRDLLDSLHCYILHQYDIGYRIHKKEKDKYYQRYVEKMEAKEVGLDEDFMVARNIFKDIHKKPYTAWRNNTGSKYNINPVSEPQREEFDANHTLMDMLYKRVVQKTDPQTAKAMRDYFDSQDIDSDAIEDDIQEIDYVLTQELNESTYKIVQNTMTEYKLNRFSFSIGLTYYYWKYYETLDQEDEKIDDEWNINPHDGYKRYQLYIEPKYETIKAEILNNEIYQLTLAQFNVSYAKAMEYINIPYVNIRYAKGKDIHHYGIKEKSTIQLSNLLSIILYTDWDRLCTCFSDTFRKKMYESVNSAKNRNREFAQWSRKLRETVERFGDFGNSARGDYRRAGCGSLKGPFYCGMSCVMLIPEFNIRLCGATSTSSQIEVAMRFADDNGIVLQLNNNSDRQSNRIRAFNCSWISNYSGENEYLFIGGHERMRLETVRIVATGRNYEALFKALYLFDCMLSGAAFKIKSQLNENNNEVLCNSWVSDEIKDDKDIIRNLMEGKVTNKYARKTFQAFVNHKKQIVFNMEQIFYHFNKISDLILHPVFPQDTKDYREAKCVNMFMDKLFQVFVNLEEIIVYTVGYDGKVPKIYPFDLLLLLDIISNATNISAKMKITINANVVDDNCWLDTKYTAEIEQEFEAKKWDTLLKKTQNTRYQEQYCLYITRH